MPFNNIFFPSDLNGTGCWRGLWPIQSLWAMGPKTNINTSITQLLSTDHQFYKNLNQIMIQRFVNDQQEHIFSNLILPMSKIHGFWTVYNIDDAMHYEDIVPYNRGRRAYLGKSQENIKKILDNVDFVLTTTDYIKAYYTRRYGVPEENIICIPNFLPKWWIGQYYNKTKSLDRFRKHKNRPRIGIVSSLSHFNVEHIKQDQTGCVVWEEKNSDGSKVWKNERGEIVDPNLCSEIPDDLDTILDCIKNTVDDVKWVFLGYSPPKLKSLIDQGKIEYHPGVSILNYPAKIDSLELQAIIAPITNSEFNLCKSNIKWLESSALGIPLFAPNLSTYNKYMPETQLYVDQEDLKEKLLKLKFGSAGLFEKIIESQFRFLNTPHSECGVKSQSWWLEDNLRLWGGRFFSMRKKPQTISISKFLKSKENVIHQSSNGIEVIA